MTAFVLVAKVYAAVDEVILKITVVGSRGKLHQRAAIEVVGIDRGTSLDKLLNY